MEFGDNRIPVEFDTDKWQRPSSASAPNRWLIRMTMKLSGGKIKTEQGATYVLLIFSILLIVASFIIFTAGDTGKAVVTEDEVKSAFETR